jgi:hypothetical protein
MRTLRSEDPRTDKEQLQALRTATLSTYARPRAEIEKELQDREEEFRGLGTSQVNPASGRSPTTSVGGVVYEIRHDKLSHFGPKTPVPDSRAVDAISSSGSQTPDSEVPQGSVPSGGIVEQSPAPTEEPETTVLSQTSTHARRTLKPKDASTKRGRKPAIDKSTTEKSTPDKSTKAKRGEKQSDGASACENDAATDTAQ